VEIVFGILGQTAMRMHGNLVVNWAGPRVQQVLAALLTAPNRRIPLETVVDWVWAEWEQRPQDERSTMHQYVTRIRRAFEQANVPARLSVGRGGCTLEVDPALIDVGGFREATNRAREFRDGGHHERAHVEALEAVRLWRDTPLADLRTDLAEDWRVRWVRTEWIPANVFVVGEQLAVGQPEMALRRLSELDHAHPMELGLVKARIRALAALERFSEATDYFFAMRHAYHEAGDIRAADELLAVHENVVNPRPAPPVEIRVEPPAVPQIRYLPPDNDDVTGRGDLFAVLDAFTTDSAGAPRRAVVAVTGPPGVGKTTMAARWAHGVTSRYRHGVVMLDLHGDGRGRRVEASEVVDTVLSLLDYPVDRVVSPVARAAKLRALLERRPMLVVLDNVQHSDHVEPLLGVLSACAVVIVSRRRLNSLSARHTFPVVTVGPLADRHARALLARRIGPRAQREEHGLAELAGTCQGLPLALTIVAERAVARAGTRLQTLAAQLRDADMLLDLGDEGDSPGTSLRSAFTLSYQALGPAEQRVFAVVGLHPGAELTGAVIAAADGRPPSAVRRSLDVLVAAHLIEHPGDMDRYRVHDLLHLYAASLASHLPDVVAARRRMLECYLHAAFEMHRMIYPHKERPPMPPAELVPAFASAAEARQWCLRERSNLSIAVQAAHDHGLHDIAWTLPALTGDVLDRYGCYEDILTALAVAASSAEVVGNVEAQASSLNDLGQVHLLVGNDAEAERFLRQAFELVTAHGMGIGRVSVMLNLARRHLRAGRTAEAVKLYRETLELAQTLGEPERHAAAAHRLADALVELGRHEDEAVALYRRALDLRERMRDVAGLISTHTALGDTLRQLGRYAEADRQCREASVLVDETQHLPAAMKLNTVIACLRHAEGDDGAALRHANRAVELAERSAHATGQARALSTLARILFDRGNVGDARGLWEQAAELYRGRQRELKAERIEAQLVELDARQPFVPEAREGDEDTVAMLPPQVISRNTGK